MLNNLEGKTIALIGYQTLATRILLKKIVNSITKTSIIALQIGKENLRRQAFVTDHYFTSQQQRYLVDNLNYVDLNKLPEYMASKNLTKIDLLVNLYQPFDFQNKDQIVEKHLLTTSSIVSAFSQINVTRCILLSSIYIQQSGYVGQQEELQDQTIPQKFRTREQADNYLTDNFNSQIQSWKWSIAYIERSYFSVCKSIVVVRVPSLGPTLINNQGYTMQINKITSLIHKIGTGNIHTIYGVKKNKVDIIPVDYLSNLIFVLMCRNSSNKAETINLSTSTRNYITLQDFVENSKRSWQDYGYKTNKVRLVEAKWAQKMLVKAQKTPSQLKKRLGTLLQVASWKIQGQIATRKLQDMFTLTHKYRYFLQQEWLCQCIKTIDIYNQLNNQQQHQFNFNVNNINWKVYIKLCVYSIIKHVMHRHAQQFQPEAIDLLGYAKNESYFSDIMWALRQGKSVKAQTRNDAIQFVLNSKSVKETIKAMVQQSMLKLQNTPTSFEKAQEQLTKVAEQICFQMFSDYSMNSIRIFAWFLTKLFKSIYQRVVVDKDAIAKIKAHDQNQGPLIIIPTHRSYIDFLIMSYVFFGYGVKCPHVAAAEDFLGMAFVHILLRKSGAFFIKRNQKKYKQLYKAIMHEYLSKLMINNHYLEFFVEGTRSRTGKMLAPKFGILSVIASNVTQGKLRDAFILPVSINYQKILEGNSFTYEMMGEAKTKESLSRVLKAVDVFKQNYGRIYIEFCDLISVKDWMSNNQGDFTHKIATLGDKIVRDLGSKLVIAGPAIVASVVLMNRKGISDDSLQQQSSWLAKQISSRGYKITRSQADSSISVNSTLSLLEGILSKSQKDMFQVQVNFQQTNFVKLFTLTYYRNTLSHIFFVQAIIATALSSFGYKAITGKHVTTDQLFSQSLFLWKLLQNEFYGCQDISKRQNFDNALKFLVSKGIVKIQQGFVQALNLQGHFFNFYWSLIWPIVQSYWLTCLYLFKLLKNKLSMPNPKLLTEIQWFGQSLINERICNYLESISSDTIKNAVVIYTNMKIVVATKQDIRGESIAMVKIAVEEQQLSKLLQKLQTYLKNSYAKSLKGILESTQGNVNLDFPFLSRL